MDLNSKYKLITEDNSTPEEIIDYLKMLSSKVNEKEKLEILALVKEIETEIKKQNQKSFRI